MRKILMLIASAALQANSASAASNIGQCVYPKTNTAANGNLVFANPIYIRTHPSAPEPSQLLSNLSSFTVGAEADDYIQLITMPNYSQDQPELHAGKVFGWAKASDFYAIELRNCN